MVWSIIGWALLGLLGLLLLALVLPTVLYVDARNGAFTLKVRILFVKLTLFPFKEKKSKPKKEKKQDVKKEEDEEEKKEEKPKKTPSEIITLVKRIVSSAGVFLRRFLRHIRIKDLELVLPVSSEDASDVAINCGRIQMLIGATHAVLEERMHVTYKRLVVLPDYANQFHGSLIFSCKVAASPVIMLAAAIAAGIRFLRYKPVSYTKADYVRAQRANAAKTSK